jgi:hypothetical protein
VEVSYAQDLAKAARERRIRFYGDALRPIAKIFRKPPPPPEPVAPPPKLSPIEARRLPILTLTALPPPRPTAASIIDLIASIHEVKASDIIGRRRSRKFVHARAHAIATLCEFRKDLSTPHIGKLMGGLDHSTVIHHRDNWSKTVNALQREAAAVYEALARFKDAEPMVG